MTDQELELMCDEALALLHAGNVDGATAIWTRAAEHGSPRAMYNLGYQAEARGEITEAKRLYQLAADADTPYALAVYNLSVLAIGEQDLDLGAELSERAAALGVPQAAHNRGQLFSWADDIESAKMWWSQGAQLGNGSSAYNLGICADADGDSTAARSWFERAAELGHADGINNVGVALMKEGNRVAAMDHYERAAEAGSVLAMNNLSELAQLDGRRADAIAWMQRAADTGDETSKQRLASLQNPAPERSRITTATQPPQRPDWNSVTPVQVTSQATSQVSLAPCGNCGASRPGGGKYCVACGAKLLGES